MNSFVGNCLCFNHLQNSLGVTWIRTAPTLTINAKRLLLLGNVLLQLLQIGGIQCKRFSRPGPLDWCTSLCQPARGGWRDSVSQSSNVEALARTAK